MISGGIGKHKAGWVILGGSCFESASVWVILGCVYWEAAGLVGDITGGLVMTEGMGDIRGIGKQQAW